MDSDKKDAKNYVGMNIGGVVGDHGSVNINRIEVVQGNKITLIRKDNSRTEIDKSDPFFETFEKLSAKAEPEVVNDVDEIRAEAIKGESANPGFIQQRLINLAKMAPDIFEVVTQTLINPVGGFAVAIQKVAQKSKQEFSVK